MRGGRRPTASMAGFKRDLLRNLLQALRARADAVACPFGAMSLQDRRRAVKRSADVAMAAAAARGGRARWPKAVLAAAAAAPDASGSSSTGPDARRVVRKSSAACKRVLRRCAVGVDAKRRVNGYAAASAVARRMLKRRTMALRKLIPGGDAAMDEASLLRETMDYVLHLRAQVDVLRRVAAAVHTSTFLLRVPSQSMGES